MKTKIQKWGNSFGVRIPKDIVMKKSLKEGSDVEISLKGGAIVIEPSIDEISLKTLLTKMSPDAVHQETDWGVSVGKESW